MKLLCICPIGIGNYLLAYPACRLIKTACPELSLHLLSLRSSITAIASKDPLWDRIHTIDPTKEFSKVNQLRFITGLRKEHYDISLNLFPSNTWQYNVFPALCGARRRMGFRYPLKKLKSLSFLTGEKIAIDPNTHDVLQNIRIAQHFTGQHLSRPEVVFPPLSSPSEITEAATYCTAHGIGSNRIGIHPGSSAEHGMDAKRWAPDRFAGLADLICKETGTEALIFGGNEELELKKAVSSGMNCKNHIVHDVGLGISAALIQSCKMFLGNDSGLMHMAACSGVPVAALFGPTDERRNGPYGTGHCVIRKPMPGFPLWTASTVGSRKLPPGVDPMASLKALSVQDAWEIIKPWLATLR